MKKKSLELQTFRQNKFQETQEHMHDETQTMSLCKHHTIHWLQQCSLTSIKIKSIIHTQASTQTQTYNLSYMVQNKRTHHSYNIYMYTRCHVLSHRHTYWTKFTIYFFNIYFLLIKHFP